MRVGLYGAILFVPLRGVFGTAEEPTKCLSTTIVETAKRAVAFENGKPVLQQKFLSELECVHEKFRKAMLGTLKANEEVHRVVHEDERFLVYAMMLIELGMFYRLDQFTLPSSGYAVPEISISIVGTGRFRVILCLFRLLGFDTLVVAKPSKELRSSTPISDEDYKLLKGCGITKILCLEDVGEQILRVLRLTGEDALQWDNLETLELPPDRTLDPETVSELVQRCDNLTNLGVAVKFSKRGDKQHFALLEDEKFLGITTKLAVHIQSLMNAGTYQPIFSQMKKLERLKLDIISEFEVGVLEGDKEPAFCNSLKHLELWWIPTKKITLDGLLSMLSKVKNLEELRIGCGYKDSNIACARLLESPTIKKSIKAVRIHLDLSDHFDFSVLNGCRELSELTIALVSPKMGPEAEKKWEEFLKSNENIKTLDIRPAFLSGKTIPDNMLTFIVRYAKGFKHIRLLDDKKDIFKILFSEKPGAELQESLETLEITDNRYPLKRECIENLAKYCKLRHLVMLAPSERNFDIPLCLFGIQMHPKTIQEMRGCKDWKNEWGAAIKELKLKENTLYVTKLNINTIAQMIDGNESVEKLFVYFGDNVYSFDDIVHSDGLAMSRLDAFLAAISDLGTVRELHLSGKNDFQLDEKNFRILFRKEGKIWNGLEKMYLKSGIVDKKTLGKLRTEIVDESVSITSVGFPRSTISWDRRMCFTGMWLFFYEGISAPLHLRYPYDLENSFVGM